MTTTKNASEMKKDECIKSLALLDWENKVSLFFETQQECDESRKNYNHDDDEIYIGETSSLEVLQDLCRQYFDDVK